MRKWTIILGLCVLATCLGACGGNPNATPSVSCGSITACIQDGRSGGVHTHVLTPNAEQYRLQEGMFYPAEPGEPGWVFRLTFSGRPTGYPIEEDADQAPGLYAACPTNVTLTSLAAPSGEKACVIPPSPGEGVSVARFYEGGILYSVYGLGTTRLGVTGYNRMLSTFLESLR